jgi:hypothetical protein
VLDPRTRKAEAADLGYVVIGGETGSRRGLGTVTRHEHLAQDDQLIADCLDRIARQREVIKTEYEQGLPTGVAESMLRALEESLRAFENHRQYIVDRLNDAERS